MKPKKVAFKTLGCRLNQLETDSLVTDFHNAGYEIVEYGKPADVYIINTCTVTNQSDQKSKHSINYSVRSSGENALVVVTGCMVTSQKEYLENRDDITYVVDNPRKSSVLSLIDSHFKGEIVHPSALKQDLFNFSVVEKGFHTRSAIKIQDGCDNFCSYCIVPRVRGRAVSRPVKDILDNIRESLDIGKKEMVLTGVNISRYNHNGVTFKGLLEKILALSGDFRVRISSIEPDGFTEKFIELFENPKLCPHLHLCLQSGSDKVLLQMRRFYSIQQFLGIIEQFRSRFNRFNFTTDVIVGFPGETDEDFYKTCEVIRQVGFSHIHTFKYSERNGTRAARMDNKIPGRLKNERSEIVRQIAEEMKLTYRKSFIGDIQTVLTERRYKGITKGYGEHFIPVEIDNNSLERNSFYKVKVTDVLDDEERTILASPIFL
ncbi:MAG: tRNA (N(6)-L-threonylcarbamoyladenosine(37)-C(2))-methylthiotransferase MtaB [Bacteroidales bacterium]|nr:tRNA (N(6)-L-threonylcarbamoyladenosine(37)-C(2))-methylthiotransferase MtaB [Bacteroidales bacterium]